MSASDSEGQLQENFIECLRLSDRAIITSLVVLFFGAIAATRPSDAGPVSLPVGGLTVVSTNTALWILLALHFANGIRYAFLLLRARSIGRRLKPEMLKAARSYPAAATSNVTTE